MKPSVTKMPMLGDKSGSMPPKGKYKGVMNEYDSRRPKKQVMTKLVK